MQALILPTILVLAAAQALAQDGAQLYTLYCGACHGADGKGATGGQFPPLAGSNWVAGEPDRAIMVVLKGLTGPVQANGKTYNLEMPPQGAMLSDSYIAAILSYVRSSWGNQGGGVEESKVKELRAATAERAAPWTADELLKLHPLPLERTALTDLISRSYEGEWTSMPDFSKLTAANVEEEHDGLLDVADSPFEDFFAMLWEGRFEAPQEADYEFLIDADDAATLWIDDKEVVAVTGTGEMNGTRARQGEVALSKGSHPIRVGFLEAAGQQSIALGWRIAGESEYRWLSERRTTRGRRNRDRAIPVAPEDGRPVHYRNFIDGTTPRAIGFGFPGGLNLAYSADHLAPELLWTGDFIDGAAKWLERGTRPSPPAGDQVTKLSSSRYLPEDARFRGYQLDEAGNPTFVITLGDQTLRDTWKAGTSTEGTPCLVRVLSLNGGSGTLRVPLGNFDPIESSVATEPRDGMPAVVLKPGMPTTHNYVLPQ